MPEPIKLVVITPADVSAFVDGELSPEERRDVMACARDDDRVACLIGAWRWQIELLHEVFGRTVEEPIPERLRRPRGDAARRR
jgi:anti-sigma factor RsiW